MAEFDRLWDYDNPAATEQRFRELLPSLQGAEHAELLTQIARTLGLQKRFEEAHATLDEAARLITDEMVVPRLRLALERGRAYRSAGEGHRAVPLFEQVWREGMAAGEEEYAVDGAHMLAITLPTAEEQLAWSEKGLAVAERSPKAARWLGPLYNNTGWTLADAGRYAEALEVFQRAVAWREQQGQPVPLRIARYAVGAMLRRLNRLDEALALFLELEGQLDPQKDEGGFIYEELGECLLALGRTEEARPRFARAYERLSKDWWLADNEPERLARLKALSE
jgi:tetratricopeptide (TPR) repeat protein